MKLIVLAATASVSSALGPLAPSLGSRLGAVPLWTLGPHLGPGVPALGDSLKDQFSMFLLTVFICCAAFLLFAIIRCDDCDNDMNNTLQKHTTNHINHDSHENYVSNLNIFFDSHVFDIF